MAGHASQSARASRAHACSSERLGPRLGWRLRSGEASAGPSSWKRAMLGWNRPYVGRKVRAVSAPHGRRIKSFDPSEEPPSAARASSALALADDEV